MKKIFTLIAGIFTVAIIFGQTQRLVLFESFSGENCPPCAAVDPLVYQEINNNVGTVVLVSYVANVPTPGLLWSEDPTDANDRFLYYLPSGNLSTPWAQQDGWLWGTSMVNNISVNTNSNDPDYWVGSTSYLTNEANVTSPFTITVWDTFTATDSFYASVIITAAQNFSPSATLKLQMAMVEDLQFDHPIGNNGETYFPHTVRKMYPSSSGTTIQSSWTNGQTKTYTFKGVVPSYVRDKSQLNFVAFIQDLGNSYVEQTGITNPFVFDLDASAPGVNGNFANCSSSSYTPMLNVSNVGNQTISSYYVARYIDGAFIDSIYEDANLPAGNSIVLQLPSWNLPSGLHTLSFTITSPNGVADPNPGNNTASITVNIATQESNSPLTEGFENGDPSNDGWAVEDFDHDSSWRVANTGSASAHSFMLDYFTTVYVNTLEEDFVGPQNNFYSPPVNLTYAAHATVQFDYANQGINYGSNGVSNDSLYIDVSSDCGKTWATVYQSSGYNNGKLYTAPEQNYTTALVQFLPTAGEWKTDSADISVVANHDNVLVRFRPVYGAGNNLYLDNINIYKYDSIPYTAGIEPVSGIQSMSLYPNPAAAQVTVSLQLEQAAGVSSTVTDITGNTVLSFPAQFKNAGQNIFSINTASLSDGIYFLTVSANDQKISRKVTVMH